MKQILIIDDDQSICSMLTKFLESEGYKTDVAKNGSSALDKLRNSSFDLALLDYRLPDIEGLELLKKIKVLSPKTESIVITGYSDVRIAVQCMRLGAFDYITKPLYSDEVLINIKDALRKKSKKERVIDEFVFGNSRSSKEIIRQIDLVAPTNMTVLILGETGTGKEYVARLIHSKSERANKPFIALDCGALPENLASSELFGHVKGAFTGAISEKKGCFELADKGTLFLDEIGNLSYENQLRLLRVLQELKVKKIGSSKSIPVDVRILAATNNDLKKVVDLGDFREDLYHRINEFDIYLPPLRERIKDISSYMEHFLKLANKQLNKNVVNISPEAEKKLLNYHWHGNLRELKNVIKKAVLLSDTDELQLSSLPEDISGLVSYGSLNGDSKDPTDLKAIAEMAERNAILDILEKTGNNKSEAAKLLNVDRKTLYNKIRSYNIDV